jgi:uncharacterized protein
MNLYLDSNALIKLYHKEAGTERLVELLNANSPDLILTVSDIAKIEFCSAILKRVRKKEISLKTSWKVFSALEDDFKMFNVIEVDNAIKSIAVDLLKEIGATSALTTLDSIQLAAAIAANDVFPIDIFVTSDLKLTNITGKYFQTFNPEE